MSHWNYRVMRRTVEGETFDAVYEVYYLNDETINGWSEDPAYPMFHHDSDDGDLLDDIERFIQACEKPVLDWETGKPLS